MLRRSLLLPLLAFAASACTTTNLEHLRGCPEALARLDSPPGERWREQQAWRYGSQEDAISAYKRLGTGASPWPDWFIPAPSTLLPGTRFQMAIGGTQSPEQPGSFGTFDAITSVRNVREFLAVRQEWKPHVDRVVTYEVIKPMPAKVGPVGPQIDPQSCRYLPGRHSQLQLLVPASERMSYLRVVAVRAIR